MRILITGCAGFIGSHLTEAMLDRGHTVVGIDCFNDNYGRAQKLTNLRHAREWDSFEFVPIDLSRGDLAAFVAGADIIFHLAAEPGVRSSWGARYSQYVRNNILATQRLLDACRATPAVRVVYASSSSIYGNSAHTPTPEHAPAQPISPYGQTKLGAEQLCDLHRETYGLDVVALRYFTVFGPRQRPDMAFHRFCRAALDRQPITVYGDGRQTRDFTFVGDIVAATWAAATKPLHGERVFNVGAGAPTTVRHVLELIEQLCGHPLDINFTTREQGDTRDTSADASRAHAVLGFEPQTTLESGLAAELDWVAGRLSTHGLSSPGQDRSHERHALSVR